MSTRRDWHDLFGGALMVAIGAGVGLYAWNSYAVGSLARMGPGFFPVVLGALLALLGAAMALPAWRRSGLRMRLRLAPVVSVLAAILVFAWTLQPFGLLLATMLTVLVCTIPDPRRGLGWRVLLAFSIAALTWSIFIAGLRMPLPLWPAIASLH